MQFYERRQIAHLHGNLYACSCCQEFRRAFIGAGGYTPCDGNGTRKEESAADRGSWTGVQDALSHQGRYALFGGDVYSAKETVRERKKISNGLDYGRVQFVLGGLALLFADQKQFRCERFTASSRHSAGSEQFVCLQESLGNQGNMLADRGYWDQL
jgi:hypothetical protein